MTQDEVIKGYYPLVDFIANIYGKNCEVVLHDLRNFDKSIVAIRNKHITGRNLNGVITDFALKIVYNQDKYKNKKYISNYFGKTEDGKVLRSSTYFIRDENEIMIGLLCVNMDITALRNAKEVIDELIMDNLEEKVKNDKEEFDPKIENLEGLVNSEIIKTIDSFNVSSKRMTTEEKIEIVAELNEKGIFLIKGAIDEVSVQLNVSKQTVYRYLKEFAKK
jgi:predicted transcriptional regulator YheO